MQTDAQYKITPQAPIPSGFGKETTAAEALGGRDLSGKTAIVTGGYSGLGLETVRILAQAGASVIVPARTPEKARASLDGMPRVELETMDLMDPASIEAFAKKFLASGRSLDMLILSAGIMAVPLSRDARGYESQFATNHLGHFQLTAQLWPALKQSGDARVVAVSSRALRFSGIQWDDPNFERTAYEKWKAYGQSKSANALFTVAFEPARIHAWRTGLLSASRHYSNRPIPSFVGRRDAGPGRPGRAGTAGRLREVPRIQNRRAGGGCQRMVCRQRAAERQGRRILRGCRYCAGCAGGCPAGAGRTALGDRSGARREVMGAQRGNDRCQVQHRARLEAVCLTGHFKPVRREANPHNYFLSRNGLTGSGHCIPAPQRVKFI
ncbi:SDR family NAD(P)-dependent oxidoreductase [Paenibacillus sp. TAB 01]|uniref:SDR family NAD(P)-dependent oxidoreductase n=1 Tax=Paenibacillus sp. TAB 01 TaxID=3368988 RepID=UPI00375128BC